MNDLQPHQHGEDGRGSTHSVCQTRFKKEKGKSKCCFCDPHKNCWFKQVDIKKSYPQLYPKIAGH